jgi:hypothetical protein
MKPQNKKCATTKHHAVNAVLRMADLNHAVGDYLMNLMLSLSESTTHVNFVYINECKMHSMFTQKIYGRQSQLTE